MLAWLMGLFFLLFFICVWQSAADREQFTFGVPRMLQMALWLPLAAIPLVASTAWSSVRSWQLRYWSVAGRVHYTLVAVAGLVLLSWLYYWNLLGFHYN